MRLSSIFNRPRPHPILDIEEINKALHALCVPPNPPWHPDNDKISQENVQKILSFLQVLDNRSSRPEEQQWSLRPRLYAILLNIGATDLMDHFIAEGLTDFNLPFSEKTLPPFITEREGNDLRDAFFAIQGYCLAETDVKLIETKNSVHCTWTVSGDTYFIPEGPLGQGSYG